jgi:hypothetical protein
MTRSHELSGSIPVLDRRGWLRWAALASAASVLPLACSRRPEAVSEKEKKKTKIIKHRLTKKSKKEKSKKNNK